MCFSAKEKNTHYQNNGLGKIIHEIEWLVSGE
jgi:hypothetical protein